VASFFISPTVRLYWLYADPEAAGAETAGVDAAGAEGLDWAAVADAGVTAVVDAAGAAVVDAGAAAVVDVVAGETGFVVEVVAVPLQPVSITAITTIPTSAEKNFLTLNFLLFLVYISAV